MIFYGLRYSGEPCPGPYPWPYTITFLLNIQAFEDEFENWTPKKEELQTQEKQLTESINPEDLSILNQRLRLLNKQWEEIKHQVSALVHVNLTLKKHACNLINPVILSY